MIYGQPEEIDNYLINKNLIHINEKLLNYPILGETYDPRTNLKEQVRLTKRIAENADVRNSTFNKVSDVNLYQPFVDYMEANRLRLSPHQSQRIKEIMQEAASVITKEKFYWNIPRPYQIMPITVKYVAKTAKSPSYPSGHSTQGMLLANMLSDLFPEHREALLGLGVKTGFARIELGVHTPQDVKKGRELAYIIYNNVFT